MANSFTLCLAPSAHPGLHDSLQQTLCSADIKISSSLYGTTGILILIDHERDWEWVCTETAVAKANHCRVMIIWHGSIPLSSIQCWRLAGDGAGEIIQWREHAAVIQMLARLRRWLYIEQLLDSAQVQSALSGNCLLWRTAMRKLIEIAIFSKSPVLIMGESGTGKEMAARLIHALDNRPHKMNLTLLDCSSLSPELSGSEFFGHEKGAFTNAVSTRDGAFENAHNGTLFLDEIGELPLHLQAELLRITQEGTFKRLGSNQWRKTDFRLISATNRDIEAMVLEKTFRQDLFYRISTWICHLPPLRDRVEDIPVLIETFVSQMFPDIKNRPVIDPLVIDHLCVRQYPGNVRELRQVITRMVNGYTGSGRITLGDLAECDRPSFKYELPPLEKPDFARHIRQAIQEGMGLKSIVQQTAQIAKDLAIAQAGGNLQQASSILQVSDRTLQLHLAGNVSN